MAPTVSRSSTLMEVPDDTQLHDAVGGKIDLHSEPIYEEFGKAIESQPVHAGSLQAIQDLTTTLKCIRTAFRKIRQDLERFDDRGYQGKDGVVLRLCPAWDKLHEHFHEILEISRDNATEAAAFMRQFTDTMLEDLDLSDKEAAEATRDELANFTKKLAEKENKAGTTKKEFRQLADDVYTFNTQIDLTLENAEAHILEQMNTTRARIADLHIRLKQIANETIKMATACLASLTTAALGVGLAIVTLAPEAFVLAIRTFNRNARTLKTSAVALGRSSSGLAKLLHDKQDVKEELNKCSREALQLIDKKDSLLLYKNSVQQTQSDIRELSSKINTFVDIWNILKQDLHSFNEQLGYAADPAAKVTKFFQKKIANTRSLYKVLIVLLEAYAKSSMDTEDEETLCDSDVVGRKAEK